MGTMKDNYSIIGNCGLLLKSTIRNLKSITGPGMFIVHILKESKISTLLISSVLHYTVNSGC